MTETPGSVSIEPSEDLFAPYDQTFAPFLEFGTIIRELGNEAVVWATESARPTYLDPIAKIIYDVIDGQATLSELAEDIRAVFDVEHEIAASQLVRVLHLLNSDHLIASPFSRMPNFLDESIGVMPAPDW